MIKRKEKSSDWAHFTQGLIIHGMHECRFCLFNILWRGKKYEGEEGERKKSWLKSASNKTQKGTEAERTSLLLSTSETVDVVVLESN